MKTPLAVAQTRIDAEGLPPSSVVPHLTQPSLRYSGLFLNRAGVSTFTALPSALLISSDKPSPSSARSPTMARALRLAVCSSSSDRYSPSTIESLSSRLRWHLSTIEG